VSTTSYPEYKKGVSAKKANRQKYEFRKKNLLAGGSREGSWLEGVAGLYDVGACNNVVPGLLLGAPTGPKEAQHDPRGG
jgi:hypothetical protein